MYAERWSRRSGPGDEDEAELVRELGEEFSHRAQVGRGLPAVILLRIGVRLFRRELLVLYLQE